MSGIPFWYVLALNGAVCGCSKELKRLLRLTKTKVAGRSSALIHRRLRVLMPRALRRQFTDEMDQMLVPIARTLDPIIMESTPDRIRRASRQFEWLIDLTSNAAAPTKYRKQYLVEASVVPHLHKGNRLFHQVWAVGCVVTLSLREISTEDFVASLRARQSRLTNPSIVRTLSVPSSSRDEEEPNPTGFVSRAKVNPEASDDDLENLRVYEELLKDPAWTRANRGRYALFVDGALAAASKSRAKILKLLEATPGRRTFLVQVVSPEDIPHLLEGSHYRGGERA